MPVVKRLKKITRMILMALFRKVQVFLALAAALFLLTACSARTAGLAFPCSGSDGSVHYLILGFGVVTVPAADAGRSVLATKNQTLGIVVSNQPGTKLALGYSSSQVVVIPDEAEDVRVEISQYPGGPLTVNAPAVKFNSPIEGGADEEP